MEVNPATVDYDSLVRYRRAGINRLSIGVQSFQDEELKFLGRIHTAGEAECCFTMARRAGFENINIDLIFGIPGSTSGFLEEYPAESCRSEAGSSLFLQSSDRGRYSSVSNVSVG